MPANALQIFKTALIWVGVLVAAFLLWRIRNALLIAFGAILVAILLRMLADAISRWIRLSERVALVLTATLLIGTFGVAIWMFGTNISHQFEEVLTRAQSAEHEIGSTLAQSGMSQFAARLAQGGGSIIGQAAAYTLSVSLSFIEGIVVLVISAIYLAAQPGLYREGVVQLFVPRLRKWAGETIDHIGDSLRLWLLGQLILMVLVGVLALIAVWLIGLPSPVALGLIAGVCEFIPYVGPFIGAIPAVLVALSQGFTPALWTVVAYLLIHTFEGYFVGPIIQEWFIRIPPALVLISFVAVELIFGPIGIVLAAPITVALFLAVKMFYIRDTLRQPTEIPGEE
jgi:predicted PurR-regulated permease PerM